MTDIPCIKDKCLLYPVCKNKQEVECEEIRLYYWNLKRGKMHIESIEIWAIINEDLPRLQMIGAPDEYK